MIKKKISLESHFWAVDNIENPFKMLETIFDYSDIEHYKRLIGMVVEHVYKRKVYFMENPGELLLYYKVFRSFVKACYLLQFSKKTVKNDVFCEWVPGIYLASLSRAEYSNPLLVFKSAFQEKTLEEFELFLFEIFQFALSPITDDDSNDRVTPYIHLIKMLDAAQLIFERGVE